MVYDFLPVKTTHHHCYTRICEELPPDNEMFACYIESAESGKNHIRFDGAWIPYASITIVHKNIHGLAILSTSRDDATEARHILVPKLQSIRTSPIQIIINSFAIDSLEFSYLMTCLSHSVCGEGNDLRKLAEHRHMGHCPPDEDEWEDLDEDGSGDEDEDEDEDGDPQASFSLETRKVHIAIWNQYADRNNAKLCEARMRHHKNSMNSTKSLWTGGFQRRDSSSRSCPEYNLSVVFYMAPLSAQEKAAYEVVRPLKGNVSGAAGENGTVLEKDEGAEIDGSVWESDWAEGERYIVG
jgi:hypothetical protein